MNCGGGVGGYIASRDEERYVREYNGFLVSITGPRSPASSASARAPRTRPRTACASTARTGPATRSICGPSPTPSIWRCSGPRVSREVGEAILQRGAYAARGSARPGRGHPLSRRLLQGVRGRLRRHRQSVAEINEALREHGIFGGKDLSAEFPELGQSALYCVTEIHAQADIDRLAARVAEAVR